MRSTVVTGEVRGYPFKRLEFGPESRDANSFNSSAVDVTRLNRLREFDAPEGRNVPFYITYIDLSGFSFFNNAERFCELNSIEIYGPFSKKNNCSYIRRVDSTPRIIIAL